ncbi:MAG TPA: hypothetical protein VGL59_24990 [Polyangia bacterium]|jgi:hypothetical protein
MGGDVMIKHLGRSSTGATVAVLIAAAAIELCGSRLVFAADATTSVPAPAAAIDSPRTLVSKAEAALAAGHPGAAILAYERARLEAPRAPAIAAGLARARAAANLPVVEQSRLLRAADLLLADTWAFIGLGGLVAFALGLVALAWGLVQRRGFFVLAIGSALIAGLGFVAGRQTAPPPGRAVVVAANAVARIAPFAQADPAFAPAEGTEVSIERAHDGYTLINTSEGEGWVPNNAVETIVPTGAHHS